MMMDKLKYSANGDKNDDHSASVCGVEADGASCRRVHTGVRLPVHFESRR
jgi:hypothetical protein